MEVIKEGKEACDMAVRPRTQKKMKKKKKKGKFYNIN